MGSKSCSVKIFISWYFDISSTAYEDYVTGDDLDRELFPNKPQRKAQG
jgi:hypothetical protein